MASVVSRESYFETGLEVLSDLGYGGLKLAEVCNRLGVTTGSFYHYFPSWPAYTKELVAHWMQERTVQAVQAARAEPDPRQRIATLIQVGLSLPHGAEAAIRVWSSLDPHVHSVQVAVDQQRFDILYESAFEILQTSGRRKFSRRGACTCLSVTSRPPCRAIPRRWRGSPVNCSAPSIPDSSPRYPTVASADTKTQDPAPVELGIKILAH